MLTMRQPAMKRLATAITSQSRGGRVFGSRCMLGVLQEGCYARAMRKIAIVMRDENLTTRGDGVSAGASPHGNELGHAAGNGCLRFSTGHGAARPLLCRHPFGRGVGGRGLS